MSTVSKGKEKASESEELGSDSSSDSESESSSGSHGRQPTSKQDASNTSQKARERRRTANSRNASEGEEDIIILQDDIRPSTSRIPPKPQYKFGKTPLDGPSLIRDPEVERLAKLTADWSAPEPPLPPPELTKAGRPLTKREKKELRQKTAGPDWFDLPAPSEADLPRLHREVEALRLRNQLDPKRFYKKEEGEGRGIKGLPKYFAIGQILPTSTPFGGASADNLSKSQRKRTLVDELVDDAEAKRYAKKKFEDLQSARGAKGRNTLRARQALRKQKW